MPDNYQKYLESVDRKFSLDESLIDAAVKEATSHDVVSKEKILKGEANQVFDVRTQGDYQIIVRVSRRNEPDFLQEKWAIERCQKLGVPVPEILLIKHLKSNGVMYSICIQKKMEGDTLERGNIDMLKMPEDDLKRIVLQAGEILAKIHKIETTGFGIIDDLGHGKRTTFSAEISQASEKRKELLEYSKKVGFDLKIMESIIDLLVHKSKKFANLKPKLNHGDYGAKHFMIKENKIVGILDFGETRSDSPAYDFAWWDFWSSDPDRSRNGKMFEWLKEGYTDKSLFNGDFDEIRYLIKLNMGLGIFIWYSQIGYADGVKAAKQRLLSDINFFQ